MVGTCKYIYIYIRIYIYIYVYIYICVCVYVYVSTRPRVRPVSDCEDKPTRLPTFGNDTPSYSQALYTQQHLASPQQARHAADPSKLSRAEEALFHERLGCLLFRYQALAGEEQQPQQQASSQGVYMYALHWEWE